MIATKSQAAVYIPDNADLCDVLANLPPELQRYADCARYLIHCISVEAWTDRLDKRGFARLNALLLRRYIPKKALKPLKDYLIRCGVLRTIGYSAGNFSTGYRISPRFDGPPSRVLIQDARLAGKILDWRDSYTKDHEPPEPEVIERRLPILRAMRRTLGRLSFTLSADEIGKALRIAGVSDNHVRYVESVIEHGDYSVPKVCNFGRRVHSIVTRISKEVRPFLAIDGAEVIELDVANSQPLILAAAFRRPDLWPTYIGDQHNGRARDVPGCLLAPDVSARLASDVDDFALLCEDGMLYESLIERGGFRYRERVKTLLFRDVLFCKANVSRTMTKVFANSWPGLFNAIVGLKRDQGYKAVSMLLQRMESHIVIDCVCQRLIEEHPGLSFLTIHDSALVVASQGEMVRNLIVEEFERFGVRATVREKLLSQGQ